MNGLIDVFLRRPESLAVRAADGLRLLAAASVVAATLGWGWIQFGVFMLALLAALVPRALPLPGALDIATGVAALLAAWSNVLDLYESVPGWDKLVHAVLGGLVALMAVILAQRASAAPVAADPPARWLLVALTGAFGLATGAIWEILEWSGHTYIDPGVHVGYADTIGDLAADGLGSLTAGALWFLPSQRPDGTQQTRNHAGHFGRPVP